jgi:nitrate reductase NapAB chaperone NapD
VMIELLLRWLPMDEPEILTVVIQVAAHAIFSVRIAHLNLKMVTVLRSEPAGNFLVAIQASESGGASPELMATAALCGSRQRLVGLCERTRRDLGMSGEKGKYKDRQE